MSGAMTRARRQALRCLVHGAEEPRVRRVPVRPVVPALWPRPLTALQAWIMRHQHEGDVVAPCMHRGCTASVTMLLEVCVAWVPLRPSGEEWRRLWRCEEHRA